MFNQQTFKDHSREKHIFNNRILLAGAIIILLLIVLVVRLYYLQIDQHQHFTTLSQNNRLGIKPIPPTRGLIFDRKGTLLADNLPTYTLEIIPEQVENLDQTLKNLSQLIQIRDKDIKNFHRLLKEKRHFEGVPLRFRLNDDEVAKISVNRHNLPGVEIQARLMRSYPLGESTAHVLGYVGRINKKELQKIDNANYKGTNHIGKLGIERTYEKYLHGKVGYQEVETNVRGRTLRVIKQIPPSPGKNLYLTIDIALQQTAMQAFGNEKGALVAIDPNTGQVLSLVSMPTFDPNLFVNGINYDNYNHLNNSPDRPLFNRALLGRYPPGSTVKPFYALAGLELGEITTEETVYCPGWFSISGYSHKYRDWKKWGHGHTSLAKSIIESCDVYYYRLAQRLGIDRMHKFMTGFGFGLLTNIDLIGERRSLMPSREWKRKTMQQSWYPGETLIAGIGQGYMLVTPIQLASSTATLANKGVRLQSHILYATQTQDNENLILLKQKALQKTPVHLEYWRKVIKAMEDVVHSARGTARRIGKDIQYHIAGKTGTAQVFGIGQEAEYKEKETPKHLRDHALFIAFAPADNPHIAVAVIVENGGHGGSIAAPIAGKVIKQYLKDNSINE